MPDHSIYYGGEVKAHEDGSFRTLLVRFSDATDTDLYGDYFTSETFFGQSIRNGGQIDVYYDHGLDPMIKRVPVGTAGLKFDDVGVWMEGQIEIADEHFQRYGGEKRAKAIESAVRTLAVKGKLSSSSGAVAHLVEYESISDKVARIKSWPIGEGSLTPRPADPDQSKILSLKAYKSHNSEADLAAVIAQTVEDHAGSGASVEVHIHNHGGETSAASKTNKKMPENEAQDTKTEQPESGLKSVDVNQLVADRVAEAMKAAEEKREQEAEKAKEHEEAVKREAEEMFKKFTESRTVTSPYAVNIRSNGILKDDFPTAFKYFLLHKGDTSAIKGLPGVDAYGSEFSLSTDAVQEARAAKGLPAIGSGAYRAAIKASNATDMNIGTAADGGDTVPTGFYNQIIMRRDEMALHPRLGCTNIPGTGTTVDVSIDNEADSEFIATNEASQFDQDAPAVSKVSLTLRKFTKRTLISDELLQDSGINILNFVQERVAIGWAKTMNNELVTEAETGTSYVRGGTTSGFAAGEIEDVIYNASLAPYADGFDLAWVMRSPTYGIITKITGNDRLYGNVHMGPTEPGVGASRSLMGFPVYFSQKAEAVGARAKSLLFGAWSYILYRESPSLNFLYDPYTLGDYGQARLLWYTRLDFELAQSAAVGYFEHDLT